MSLPNPTIVSCEICDNPPAPFTGQPGHMRQLCALCLEVVEPLRGREQLLEQARKLDNLTGFWSDLDQAGQARAAAMRDALRWAAGWPGKSPLQLLEG